jgi:proline iminopeptidase
MAVAQATKPTAPAVAVYPLQEGFVDAKGVMIYYKLLGRGEPLMIVHGGPGASHDYFLPYLLPLARHNRLIFIDERGSGRSQKLEDASGYTIENMVEDVEAVRQGLALGKISLLGHSYGGALAQAYALKYQRNLSHLILGSTWSSTKALNEVFEGYFPYLYQNRPDPNYDPVENGKMSWDLYREMWGSHGEFVIDGNLKLVEYTDRLSLIKVSTLILVGDHDESDPSLARAMHEKIAGSRLVIFPKAGHMTFVDQPEMFIKTVEEFLQGKQP